MVKRQLPLKDSECLFPRQRAPGEPPEVLKESLNYLNDLPGLKDEKKPTSKVLDQAVWNWVQELGPEGASNEREL
ncbi:hypothetical protein VULLAG_LOCUS23020 [Vulpes lagopus]